MTEPSASPASTPPRAVGMLSSGAKGARETIGILFLGGTVCIAAGVGLAVSESPITAPGLFGTTEHSGNAGGYAFGLALTGLGCTLTMIAIIAWGVMLGNRASRD